ncbi:hypothetical protein [Saccharothrix obliqua]|uniref:hypothetical protein n=1 Tax=Saccharothrix obliqua TaxID=2861747 RepID=UPI001C5D698C|nr:hypothetical protein [Saccharothrix obliqua]MBW4717267.1 hypothetical protein [Saccharothrix obliqua]
MSYVVMILLIAVLVTAIGLQVKMFAKDKPLLGVYSLGLIIGPGALLAVAYAAVA